MKCCSFLLLLFLFSFGIFCYGFNGERVLNGFEADTSVFNNVVRVHTIENMLTQATNATFLDEIKANPNLPKDFKLSSIFCGTCTGTIISDRHILTAAHCVMDSKVRDAGIPLDGGVIIDYVPVDRTFDASKPVLNISKHAITTTFHAHDFKWQHFQHDIAIIEFNLPKAVKLGEPVLLAKNYAEGENDVGINVGYGNMNPIANEASKIAMQINLPILPTCKSNDKDHPVICAGNSTHRPDHGDSGGPLFFTAADGKYYQIGIVHDGAKFDGTADEKNPDVTTFIRISAYCGWITNTTNNEVHCVDMPPRALEPVEVSTEAPKAAPQNGINSMSKNIFIILFTIAVLNVVFMW